MKYPNSSLTNVRINGASCPACQVEYSQRYAEATPQAQSLRHLLSEAHLLLCASSLQAAARQRQSESGQDVCVHPGGQQAEREELDEAIRLNCARLADCFGR